MRRNVCHSQRETRARLSHTPSAYYRTECVLHSSTHIPTSPGNPGNPSPFRTSTSVSIRLARASCHNRHLSIEHPSVSSEATTEKARAFSRHTLRARASFHNRPLSIEHTSDSSEARAEKARAFSRHSLFTHRIAATTSTQARRASAYSS